MFFIAFVIVGAVTSYAVGYFRERKIVEPPQKDLPIPSGRSESLRFLFECYGEEIRAKYARNHGRRRAEKFFKEFWLTTVHFVIFITMAIASAEIGDFHEALTALEMLVGLTFLTMALKAGQLTATKETVELKEAYLVHATEIVNQARSNVFANCPEEMWLPAMQARDEQTFAMY